MDAAPGPHCTLARLRALSTMDGLESLLTPFALWLRPFSQCLAITLIPSHWGCVSLRDISPMSPGSLMLQTGPCYPAM